VSSPTNNLLVGNISINIVIPPPPPIPPIPSEYLNPDKLPQASVNFSGRDGLIGELVYKRWVSKRDRRLFKIILASSLFTPEQKNTLRQKFAKSFRRNPPHPDMFDGFKRYLHELARTLPPLAKEVKPDRDTGVRDGVIDLAGLAVGRSPHLKWMLLGFGNLAVHLYVTKDDANYLYRRAKPVLDEIILLKGRDSKEAKYLLEVLAEAAQFGAKRQAFRREYIDKPFGYKDLPEDPAEFPYGLWH